MKAVRWIIFVLPLVFLAFVLPTLLLLHFDLNTDALVIIASTACALAAWGFQRQLAMRNRLYQATMDLGIELRDDDTGNTFDRLMLECSRRLSLLRLNYVENPFNSRYELSTSLRSIVNEAHNLLGATSSELALFDKDSGAVHSSFVLGMPFRIDAPTLWSKMEQGQTGDDDPRVLIQPLKFSGTILGTLRVCLPVNRKPRPSDKVLLQALAVQSAIALLNAEYSEELRHMRMVSEEGIKAKTGFLANLSHELRGPLGLILNAVELVLDELCGPISQEQRDTLGMVKKNGAHLLDLINDVLDYAKSESGRIKVEPGHQLAKEFLTEMLNVVRAQAETKKHEISMLLPDEDIQFSCDKRHSRQMMINLLTNAIKYTPPGGKITIQAERVPNNFVRFSVRDSGVGIAEEDRPKVFTAFERVEHEYSSKQHGTGLGMPLTRKLAEMNGGSVDFDSTPGVGSIFWILLPISHNAETTVTIRPAIEAETKGNGETLLIIEPDEEERSLIERYLLNNGFSVCGVSNQQDAQQVLTQHDVDLAILNNETLDHPKQQLLELIHGSLERKKIPLILMSSRAFVFDIEEYLKKGVDRCLTKPFTMKELGRTCRELIDDNRRVNRHSSAYIRPPLN